MNKCELLFVDSAHPGCTMGLKHEVNVLDDEAVSTLALSFLLFINKASTSLFPSDCFMKRSLIA